MSEDYLAQAQPTLSWNTARGVWEKVGMANLLCEHWELFSETWPTSGTMRNGQVFELPMQAHRTTDLESSLLRSPTASQGEGGALGEEEARKRGNTIGIRDNALDIAKLNGLPVSRVADNLMPTPNTMDHLPARTPEQKAANKGKGGYSNVRETVVNDLLRTPNAMDGDKGSYATASERLQQGRQVNLHHEINEIGTNWGKFEPAIRRWEEVLGRPAPAPTKPDGKDGAHRLSSAFTEWMMGVPEGWITDCGLSRNDELKACGNGVVPQQAELALRLLLEADTIETGRLR